MRPSGPIMRMYAQEIGRMLGLPHGAAETVPQLFGPTARSATGWFGR